MRGTYKKPRLRPEDLLGVQRAREERTRSLDSVREEPVILLQLSLYSQYPTATSEVTCRSRLAQVLGEPSTNLVYMDAQVLSIRKKEELSY